MIYEILGIFKSFPVQHVKCYLNEQHPWSGTLAERKPSKPEAPKGSVTGFSVNSHLITLQGPALTALGYLFQLIACHIPLCSVFSSHSAFVFSPNVHAFFFFPPLSDLCTGCAPCLEFLPYYIILHFTDSFRSSFSLHHHSLLNVFPPYIKSSISINPMHLSLKITDSSLHVVLELFNSPVCLS